MKALSDLERVADVSRKLSNERLAAGSRPSISNLNADDQVTGNENDQIGST